MAAKLILFDLDGTLYIGGKLLPGVKKLLRRLSKANIDYGFMTNNTSIAPADYLLKLQKLGLYAVPENLITSEEATCLMLQDLKLGPEIFVLGTKRFKKYLAAQGYHHNHTNPDAILVGFDLELTYEKLTTATRLITKGVKLVASHPDVVCPSSDGPLPNAGMLLAAIKAATAVNPVAIAGKPNRWIVKVAKQHFNIKSSEIVIVGDRLATDMRMARRYKMKSVLVLSGVTKAADIKKSRYKPDIVVSSVAQLVDKCWFGRLGWI